VFRWLALGPVIFLAASAHADGMIVVGGSPRSIARAGAGTVGDDGGGALLVNPASLARREGTRVQVGAALVDDSMTYEPSVANAPTAHDQAGSSLAPLAAVEGSVGAWVIGAGVMTEAVTSRAQRAPSDLPADQLGADFTYRYTGIAGTIRRDTVTIGAARRIGESVAVGLSVGASRIELQERRRLWAGFTGTSTAGDPHHDVDVAFDAEDGFAPRATAGVLVAPVDTPMEFGASLSWEARADVSGNVLAVGTPNGPSPQNTSPSASLRLIEPWTARAGVRYLAERFVIEVDGDLWIFPRDAQTELWTVRGVRVVDPTTGAGATVGSVPSRISERTRGAFRTAVDVELMDGFLWLIGGYAYTAPGAPLARLSPTFADLGGHTAAIGIELNAGSFAVTLGWSRTWSIAETQTESALQLDNPFAKGDIQVPTGRYDATADQVGIMVEAEL
jgi:hypothetical protein